MPSNVPIRCMTAYTEEAEQGGGLVPLFVGRDDGTVERYDAAQDAELGIPSAAFFAHRQPVTGIVATSAAELHTCSLDGTLKQWTLSEAPAESVHAGGARVRAALVKTTTFPFGVSVMVQENSNRLLLGGEDGSLTLMEGERRSTWSAHDGLAVTAIAVDTSGSSAVLTGGADGVVYVWDMEFGRPVCELRGHTGPIVALSLVPVPPSVPVVRQKRSADGAELKDVLVSASGDDGSTATCIVSTAADGTVKVWLLPDLREANAEAERMERQQQQQQLQELEKVVGAQRRSIGISFQEPTMRAEVDAAVAASAAAAAKTAGEAAQDDAAEHSADSAVVAAPHGKNEASTEDGEGESGEAAANASAHLLDAKEQFLRQQVAAPAVKSAIKAPERRVVPVQAALGTVELPLRPYSATTPSSSPSGGGGGEGDGAAGSSLLFIGAGSGDVYGVRTRRLVKEVCLHAAHSYQTVQQEVARVHKTLKDGSRVYAKQAAAKIKAEEKVQLAIADKARKAQMALEKAAKKKAAEERREARRRAAELAEEEGEEDEEAAEDAFHTEDAADEADEGDDEEAEEAEEGDGDKDGEGDATDTPGTRRPASWKRLTEEQRAALEEFCAAQEAERDRRVAALRASVEAHVAQVRPIAKTAYHRSRAQFAQLSHTIAGHVHNGVAVTAMAAATLVPGHQDRVYAAQVSAIVPVTVAVGLTML